MVRKPDEQPIDPRQKGENLLALLLQGGAQIKVTDGQLMIRPVELAQKLAPKIREFKSDLLILLLYCPSCLAELEIEHRPLGRHLWCKTAGHYDRLEAVPGAKLKDLKDV
jgi:hypothetical protein